MVKIEKAQTSDALLISQIGRESFVETHAAGVPKADLDHYVDEKFSLANIQVELTDHNNIFHLIYCDNEPAGYSKIIPNCPNPKIDRQDVTKLERIYLRKKFLSQKVGLQLFNFNRGEAMRLNQSGMWLIVWVENHRAIEFYRRLGFDVIGETLFKLSETRSNPNYWMYLKFPNF